MRLFALAALLLAGCSDQTPPGASLAGEWRGEGRDALCLADGRAGLITYGDGDTNCSLAGKAVFAGEVLTIAPRGDSDCRVTVRFAEEIATLGPNSSACAYYCGPGADFSRRTLARAAPGTPRATDFAGEPLC